MIVISITYTLDWSPIFAFMDGGVAMRGYGDMCQRFHLDVVVVFITLVRGSHRSFFEIDRGRFWFQ